MSQRTPPNRTVARLFTGLLVVGLAASVTLAADRNRDRKQGEAAREAINKQKDIARGLRDKANSDPAALQKQLDDLKAELQAEKDRHAAAIEPLNKDLKAQTDAGDRKRAARTQRALDKATDAHKSRTADLEKRIADLQARIDAAKAK